MSWDRWECITPYFDRSPYTLLQYRSHSYDLQNGKLTEDPFDFDTGITRSNGGLNAPIPDMLKYLNFLLGDPAHQTEYDAILKRSSLEEMWKPIVPVVPDADFASRPALTTLWQEVSCPYRWQAAVGRKSGMAEWFSQPFLSRPRVEERIYRGLQHGCGELYTEHARFRFPTSRLSDRPLFQR